MLQDADSLLAALREPLGSTSALHLNNAGVSPMTRHAHDAGRRALDIMMAGSLGISRLLREVEAARATFARLVGAAPVDTSFFQTCASAISQVAFGLPLEAGDEIVLLDQEYPSNAYPWHRAAERAGARVVVVPSRECRVELDALLTAITPRTRVVAVSWVQYSTGSTVDLRALADATHACRPDGKAWLFVDAIQGLGVIPFDLAKSGADAVVGGTQKWLLGPVGHGFLALAPGRAEQLEPLMHGAMTYGGPDDAPDPTRRPRTDPRRFEPGTPLALGAISGAASVELLLAIGVERVHAEALALADLVVMNAHERGLAVVAANGPLRSPITTLVPKHLHPTAMVEALRARGCSTSARGGGVRVSPHAHNGPQHIDALFALWDELDRA